MTPASATSASEPAIASSRMASTFPPTCAPAKLEADATGTRFHLESPRWHGEVRIGLPGRFNVSNALAAPGSDRGARARRAPRVVGARRHRRRAGTNAARRCRPAVHRHRRLRAHDRLAAQGARGPAPAGNRQAHRGVRIGGGARSHQARADGPRRGRACRPRGRDRRGSAAGGSARDQRGDRGRRALGRRTGRRDAVGDRRPARGDRARHRDGSRRATSCSLPGRGTSGASSTAPSRAPGTRPARRARPWQTLDGAAHDRGRAPRLARHRSSALERVRRGRSLSRVPAAVGVGRGASDGRLAAGAPRHRSGSRQPGGGGPAPAAPDARARLAPGLCAARTDRRPRRSRRARRAGGGAAFARRCGEDRHRPRRPGGTPRDAVRSRAAGGAVARRAKGPAANDTRHRPDRGRGGAARQPQAQASAIREQGRARRGDDRALRRTDARRGHRSGTGRFQPHLSVHRRARRLRRPAAVLLRAGLVPLRADRPGAPQLRGARRRPGCHDLPLHVRRPRRRGLRGHDRCRRRRRAPTTS